MLAVVLLRHDCHSAALLTVGGAGWSCVTTSPAARWRITRRCSCRWGHTQGPRLTPPRTAAAVISHDWHSPD
jgi:hypothetical protein